MLKISLGLFGFFVLYICGRLFNLCHNLYLDLGNFGKQLGKIAHCRNNNRIIKPGRPDYTKHSGMRWRMILGNYKTATLKIRHIKFFPEKNFNLVLKCHVAKYLVDDFSFIKHCKDSSCD